MSSSLGLRILTLGKSNHAKGQGSYNMSNRSMIGKVAYIGQLYCNAFNPELAADKPYDLRLCLIYFQVRDVSDIIKSFPLDTNLEIALKDFDDFFYKDELLIKLEAITKNLSNVTISNEIHLPTLV